MLHEYVEVYFQFSRSKSRIVTCITSSPPAFKSEATFFRLFLYEVMSLEANSKHKEVTITS